MTIFLSGHGLKDFCGLRIEQVQPLGEKLKDTAVVFFRRDGKRQNLLLAESGKGTFAETEHAREHRHTSLELF